MADRAVRVEMTHTTSAASGNVRLAIFLGRPPGHYRTRAPADDPQQPPALVVINLPDLHPFSHVIIRAVLFRIKAWEGFSAG